MREVVVTSAPTGDDPNLVRMLASWRGDPPLVYLDEEGAEFCTGNIPGWLDVKATLPACGDLDGMKPYSFRWNARKFAVKVFVWADVASRMGQGVLTWLDADTVAKKPMPAGMLTNLLKTKDVAYLGRGMMHPETGYVGFRIPEAMPLLRWCCEAYRSGKFARIHDGWTDCHVFRAGLRATKTRARDLTSHKSERWSSSVDAMAKSPLGSYMRHLKGKQRKLEALEL